ncbi:MAG: ferredoxin--NADP reductase [Acidimicrobiales bacterium]
MDESRPLYGSEGIPVPANGNFQGRGARGTPRRFARDAAEQFEQHWSSVSRYDRKARVVDVTGLTPTGTVRIRLEVVDDQPFAYQPGSFVGIEGYLEVGYRRSPYCIMSPPSDGRRFDLAVRVVPEGPLSKHLASVRPGDEILFRGPKGRSMVPKHRDRDLVLIATGVGVGPFYALASHLLGQGFNRRIDLFWGLRLVDDIWLIDELDTLHAAHPRFSYRISLSQPPEEWTGLRGRVTDSVPPQLSHLGGTYFYLCGNGAMIAEMAPALSDVGVSQEFIHEEAFFDARHVPDPDVVAAIRGRFVADDLFSPFAHREASLFAVDQALGSRSRNVDPRAPSDSVRGPDFLSHHERGRERP